MELERLRDELARLLEENGIPARTSWPEGRRTGPEKAGVLVSLEKVELSAGGMQNYLGRQLSEKTGCWEEVYGRRAAVTFELAFFAPGQEGAGRCREMFHRTAGVLQNGRPLGLTMRRLTGEETKFDSREGLMRLSAHLACEGWLFAGEGGQDGAFLDFTLRGDVKT